MTEITEPKGRIWRVTRGRFRIEEFPLVRCTPHTVTYVEGDGSDYLPFREARQNRSSEYAQFFLTREQAVRELRLRAEGAIRQARRKIEEAEKFLKTIEEPCNTPTTRSET